MTEASEQAKALLAECLTSNGPAALIDAAPRFLAALIADVERLEHDYEPCEPCKHDDHDHCTGDCPSWCCAIDAYERAEDTRAVELLTRYVDEDLVEAGDAFGVWDDDVREFVSALASSADTDGEGE